MERQRGAQKISHRSPRAIDQIFPQHRNNKNTALQPSFCSRQGARHSQQACNKAGANDGRAKGTAVTVEVLARSPQL